MYLRELEAENSQHKRMYAIPSFENDALKELIEKSSETRRKTSLGQLAAREGINYSTGLPQPASLAFGVSL